MDLNRLIFLIDKYRHGELSDDESRELRQIITDIEPEAAGWSYDELVNLGLAMIAGEQMRDDMAFLHTLREKLKNCPLMKEDG